MKMTGRVTHLSTLMAPLAVLLLLSSCATPTKPLAPDAGRQLQKIGLLEVQGEDQYSVTNLYLEGIAFGGVVNFTRSQEFTTMLRQRDFRIGRAFADDLANALTAAGFEVERVDAARKAGQISHSKSSADALLYVLIGAGYISHGVDDYVPTVRVRAELLENKTGQESRIYTENYCYGYKPALLTAIEIAAPSQYSYGSYDKLLQSNVEASEGLLKGADLISDRLAKEIAAAKH